MITIEHRLADPHAYLALVAETGWDMPTLGMTKALLSASLCGVTAVHNGQTVGMARAVGDGVMKVYIQDVIVTHSLRHNGLGQKLMLAILSELTKSCPPSCMIGLFAAEGRSEFYARLGFISRPGKGFGPGMHGTLSELAKADDAA